MTPSKEAMELTDEIIKLCFAVKPGSVRQPIAELIDSAFVDLRKENERLREACRLAADELTHATWAKGADQRGLKHAIEKCEAALAATEHKP